MVSGVAAGAGAPRSGRRALWLALVLAFAVVLWGGYQRGWTWTGVHGRRTLWDWLVLVLPALAVAVVPLWLTRRRALSRRMHLGLGAAAAAFLVLVALGYGLDLEWTGFPGNTLWDWLELLVLPLVIATWPFWAELRRSPRRRERATIAAGVGCFALLVLLGYALDWRWTGFAGNTLWDWLHLLLLPLLVPLVLVPAVLAALEAAAIEYVEQEHEAPQPAPAAE